MPTPVNPNDLAKVASFLASKALHHEFGSHSSVTTKREEAMAEITQTILTEIGNDLSIDTMNICVDLQEKGLFKKNKSLHIFGTVRSQDQMNKVEGIVRRHAGSIYQVVNHLSVK